MGLSKVEAAIILLIISGGITFEYFDEFVISKGSPASDVFPPKISSFDKDILLRINPGILNPTLNTIFTTITHLGSTLAVALFGICLFLHSRI